MPKGAVIVVQEAFGVNDHIKDVAAALRRRGLPRGRAAPLPPQRRSRISYDDLTAAMPHITQLTDGRDRRGPRRRSTTCTTTASRTRASPSSASAWAAPSRSSRPLDRKLGAAVTFYGGGIAEGRFGAPAADRRSRRSSQTPWLGLLRRPGPGHPGRQVEQLREAVAGARRRHRDRPLPRRRPRLPLRRPLGLPRGRAPATPGRARSRGWTRIWPRPAPR